MTDPIEPATAGPLSGAEASANETYEKRIADLETALKRSIDEAIDSAHKWRSRAGALAAENARLGEQLADTISTHTGEMKAERTMLAEWRGRAEAAEARADDLTARHAAYLERVEKVLGPIRQRRDTGEPARGDVEEVRDLRQRAEKAEAERDAEKARADAADRARAAVVQGEECRNEMRYLIAKARGLMAECLALNPTVCGDMEKVRVWAGVIKAMQSFAEGDK